MITVCLASYNGSKYIKEQVSSILNQLSPNDELIISDDGSIDDTIFILKNFNDSRIKIYKNNKKNTVHNKYSPSHYKVTSNFENALNYASGDYIFLADQDDIWYENKVSMTIEALQKYSLVVSNFSIINENDIIIKSINYNSCPISKSFIVNLINMPFYGCCMAFRKDILKYILPFPNNLIMHDNWIGLNVNLRYREIGYIDTPLIKYRRHNNNVSPTSYKNKNPFWFKVWYRLILCLQVISNFIKRKKQ